MSKIPLKSRKSIRDTEDKFKQSASRIQKALNLPVEVTLDVDWAMIDEASKEAGYENRCGEVVHDWIIGGLASNLEKFGKDELARNSICEAWTSGVINLREGSEQDTDFEDGNLVITFKKGSIATNVSYTGYYLEKKLQSSDGGLSLKAAQNISENKKANDDNLKEIQKALNLPVDVTLDIDMQALAEECKTAGYEDRPGEVLKWLLDGLKSNIQKIAKNDIAKAAINETWTSGVINWRTDSGIKNYNDFVFENGDGVIVNKPGSVASNCSYLGYYIEDSLAAPEGSGLTLKSATNIKENEGKLKECYTKMEKALQLPTAVTPDIDWTVIEAASKRAGYDNRPGEVWVWLMQGLTSYMEKYGKDEMVREAIQEEWTTGSITHREDSGLSGYNDAKFEDGNLVVITKPDGIASNCSYLGSKIEENL